MKTKKHRVGTTRWFVAVVAVCFAAAFMANAAHAAGGGASKPKQPSRVVNYTVVEAGDVSYVKLNVMMLPIFKDFKLRARIALGINFETKSGDESKVTKVLPRLQAKYTEFVTQRGNPAIEGGKLRVRFLRKNLQKITDRAIGKGVATVLVREAFKL